MDQGLQKDFIEEALQTGEIELQGQFILGSNATLLVRVAYQTQSFIAVYKPERGERPLWDFPYGSLEKREAAAYVVSEALGWHFVPTVVYRENGPYGPGSFQVFVEHDPDYHYFNFSPEDVTRLRPAVAFDLLINNADRKGGHIIKDEAGHLWLIDHGLCFHQYDKLRTVLWDFEGEQIPADILADIEQFIRVLGDESQVRADLDELLSQEEVGAIMTRGKRLLRTGVFPQPDENQRQFPWPPV